jgi:hypothetical protein
MAPAYTVFVRKAVAGWGDVVEVEVVVVVVVVVALQTG